MPQRAELGKRLKEKYESAVRVRTSKKAIRTVKKRERHRLPQSLVYESDGADFCRRNVKRGSLGTSGRVCNASSGHDVAGGGGGGGGGRRDDCETMCCGRGYDTMTRMFEEPCNCSFTWCCTVKCDKCLKGMTQSYCR